MADMEETLAPEGAPELNETLEMVLVAALNEMKRRLVEGEELVPFTALAIEDTLHIETHPKEEMEESFVEAEERVSNSEGAAAYAFCYDGFVETEEGPRDILIAEGGLPGESEAHAIGLLYNLPEEEGDELLVDDEPVYLGPAPNFME